MSSNHPRTKGRSSQLVNFKIWRLPVLITTVLVVAVAAGYVGTGATPGVLKSVSRTIKRIFDPKVNAKSVRPTSEELVPVQDPVPTVVTDKTGYLGGEAVAITGTAFGANETVTLRVTHADGSAVSDAIGATATAEGVFEARWSMPNNSAGHGFVVTAAGNTSGASSSATFSRIATVQTDKYDYQPGETATFTGAGFYANEAVTLQVVHSNGNNFGSGHEPFEATADSDGRLTATWFVHPDDSESSIFRLTAIGKTSGLTATTTFTDVIISFIDDAGPDDEPGQKDLNAMSSDLGATAIGITWNWDDTGFGNLGGNTGDACTLVDTDQDGLANFAFCVTVDGNPAIKVANRFYSCNDTRSDRCGGPILIPAFTTTSTASVVPNSDPFSAHPNHSAANDCDVAANCLTHDTVANVTLQLSDVGGAANARLLNVCSFPSEEPNSDPSDCVIHPDRGFLTIRKTTQTSGTSSTEFSFNTSAPSAGGVSSFSANIAGSQTNAVVANQVLFAPGTYNLSEVVPAGWDLTTASCTIQSGSPTSTGTFAGNTITGLSIQTGLETICTFTNTKQGSIKVVKNTVGGDGTFNFTSNFGVSQIITTGGSGEQTVNNLSPGTGYSITETDQVGWDEGTFSCDRGTAAAIEVVAGQLTTCTISNTKQGSIKVVKISVGGDGTFNFTSNFGLPASLTTNGGSKEETVNNLVPGNGFAVSETVPTGWDLSAPSCTLYGGGATGTGGATGVTGITVQAGKTTTCTFTNTKRGHLIVTKATLPNTDTTTTFGITAGTTNGVIFGNVSRTLTGNGASTDYEVKPGTYRVGEPVIPSGWDQTGNTCQGVVVAAGETKNCTITNTQRGMAQVVKTVSGQPPTGTQAFTFQIRQGASTVATGTTVESGVANAADATIDFTTKLIPGQTYQMCEIVMPGWSTTLGSFVPDSFMPPDGVAPNPNVDNSILCVNFTVQPGETKVFNVDNTPPPGGRALTIGFWKNWSSCSSGGQAPELDRKLFIASTLQPGIGLVVSAKYLGSGWSLFAPPYYLTLKGGATENSSPDCTKTVNLLNKSTATGKKKMASDPLFNLAAQLIAAQLNYFAGAGKTPTTTTNINMAVVLLGKYGFNGDTYAPKLTNADAAKANCLATQIDNYNNNRPVSSCP